ncbi:MAG: hypothetical protein NZM06_09180 [Chloroherpetonaceae bacterium]|nr:hypothetical protein [Chloroherpetonaceae bacterium]
MKTLFISIGLALLFCCAASAQSKPVKSLPKAYLGFYKGSKYDRFVGGNLNYMASVKANEMAITVEHDGRIILYRGKYTVQKGSTENEVIVQTNLRETRTKDKYAPIVVFKSSGSSITCEIDEGPAGTAELTKED